ncbi:MAG: hypothetical protein HY652_05270, partial [Acidobacteria bacterium]|nr:hypothetical protein [Acidobacteriota bacterium]
MSTVQSTLWGLGPVLEVALLFGMLRRKHVGQAPGFFVYVAAVFVADLMLIFMWNRQFYVVREFGIDVLRLTAFYDLNRRIFRLYPGLRRSVNG